MRKKDILGEQWLDPAFIFESSMRLLEGEYEGYSALQRFLPGTRELLVHDSGSAQRLCGAGYRWLTYLPMREHWGLGVFYDPDGVILRWYFDISRGNFIDENGIPCRDDLYLDLVILPDGRTLTKDADELQEALCRGEITQEDYALAYRAHAAILQSKWSDVAFLAQLSQALMADYA